MEPRTVDGFTPPSATAPPQVKFQGTRYDADKLGFLRATVDFALQRSDLGEAFRRYLKSLPL